MCSANSFAASQGGGLPQMDIGSYPSQIFWLIITFGVLYIFMWKIAIPQLRTTVEERKDKVSTDLHDAEQLKTEAKSILEEYETKITNSNLEASSIYTNTKSDIDKKIDLSKKETEEKIKKLIEESQLALEKKEIEAIDEIKAKTIETTQSIVEKFINEKVSEDEVRKYLN
jgi:F-type H+-transporting ATPase subunit b